ncbi:MAG: HAMP domain-containing sensor histidine kinase [Pseudomonadota bacterium]
MQPNDTGLLAARGITDDRDRLVTADEPLADLQERCGGGIPGMLAVPELLELVRQSRKMGLAMARDFSAFDGESDVRGFVRINPLDSVEGGGCEVLVEHWQRSEPAGDTSGAFAARLDAIDRASSEISARLDGAQRVLVWTSSAPDAFELQQRSKEQPGAVWSDLVDLVGLSHQQPLHWRLLDGVHCKVPGSPREWRARLMPTGGGHDAPRGFELLLIASEPLPSGTGAEAFSGEGAQAHSKILGSTLTPVLRQPVARIIANAETMQARLLGPLRPEYTDYAGTIASSAQHLNTMLDDLADLAVVEGSDFSTVREAVDLNDVARRASAMLSGRARKRNITIAAPAQDVGEVMAAGETRRVIQIAINLIGNAIAYSPEGSCVTVSAAKHKGDTAALSVLDQGQGVTPAQAARIFEKFERLGRDGDGGSGLGLYISRKLARAMDGDLELAQSPGEGAEFRLMLPRLSDEMVLASAI